MNQPLQDGRRETYCLNVVSGLSGAESARLAGYCPNNPKNSRVMSWYLLLRADVRERITQLHKEASDDAILTVIQRKVVLSDIARGDGDPIPAIQELNRMDGVYRQKKVEVNVAQGTTNVTVVQPKRIKSGAIER